MLKMLDLKFYPSYVETKEYITLLLSTLLREVAKEYP